MVRRDFTKRKWRLLLLVAGAVVAAIVALLTLPENFGDALQAERRREVEEKMRFVMISLGNKVRAGRRVDPEELTDIWELPLKVELRGNDAVVASAGWDRIWGTSDDITVVCK